MVNRSHLMSASAGVAVAMAVGMGSITPAHAIDYTVTENCSASANLDIQLTVGDTYSIVNGGCTLAAAFNGTGPLPRGVGEVTINSTPMVIGGGAQLFANPGTLVYSATTAGSIQIQVNNSWPVLRSFTVTGGPSTEPAPAAAGPEDIIQQIEPTTAGCSAVNRPDLNWSGVVSGGWGSSWAPWANGGRGGAVCTRTLTFANSAWKVIAA